MVKGALIPKHFSYQWNGRIVGGQNATIDQFPYQISMNHFGSHRCGGSIIRQRVVITAAHCVRGTIRRFLNIRAGTALHNSGGVIVPVLRAFEHPDYNVYHETNNDIGLLFLDQGLLFGPRIRAIALPSRFADTPNNVNATISGWGTLTSGANTLPQNLQSVSVPIVEHLTCVEAYGTYVNPAVITETMLCAGILETGGVDSCQGDSGGPLVVNNQLHGIVSWGYGCALPGLPGVYARTSHFIDWIEDRLIELGQ